MSFPSGCLAWEGEDMRDAFRIGFPLPKRYLIGPLRPYIDRLASRLAELQYARETARLKIRVVADLSQWLERKRLGVGSLDDRLIAKFFHRRRRDVPARNGEKAAVGSLLELLRDLGVLAEKHQEVGGNLQHPTEIAFGQYLKQERGLSQASLPNILPFVHRFLTDRFGTGLISLADVGPADITQFVLRYAKTMSPGRAKLLVGALRSYFRFLHLRGEIVADLSGAVPTVADWRLSSVPRSIEPQQVERLLKICDRRTATGRRDYAVLLLLARLGLRGGEVAALTLDELDWEAGQITIAGKGSRRDRLPIPQDVGEALVACLRDRPPRCSTRRVFLTSRAPVRELAAHGSVGAIVSRCLARAGIPSPQKGSHLLRHSLAVRMLRGGASLAEIGEILRHRQLDTTAIYAKVDLTALKSLAQPWPGGEA
jgi:site-specific recombinase XerD